MQFDSAFDDVCLFDLIKRVVDPPIELVNSLQGNLPISIEIFHFSRVPDSVVQSVIFDAIESPTLILNILP